ncbi:MAG: bifunctional adenosylcobinamide kinase/adenosylcobinamide-phosphate guanylyltransferase [Eubacteriales bacterium]|nr:bifunctional adenosylcobinamide kinase/adenosylcobinamide-phosphate guanylyltransferase [Eubacteriales bacterium]
MELIIGGAFQGKLNYARELYPDVVWVDAKSCTLEEMCQIPGIFNLHLFIKKQIMEGKDISGLPDILEEKNPNMIIISNEVGYGVVPVSAFDRVYRENVGRICTKLAAKSSKVTRVVCGIGTVIKDV